MADLSGPPTPVLVSPPPTRNPHSLAQFSPIELREPTGIIAGNAYVFAAAQARALVSQLRPLALAKLTLPDSQRVLFAQTLGYIRPRKGKRRRHKAIPTARIVTPATP